MLTGCAPILGCVGLEKISGDLFLPARRGMHFAAYYADKEKPGTRSIRHLAGHLSAWRLARKAEGVVAG